MFLMACVAPALADDLNPPDWVGAEGSSYAIWNFDENYGIDNIFYPEEYVGDEESHVHADSIWGEEGPGGQPLAAFATWDGEIEWQADYQDRQGVAGEVGEMFGVINNYPRDIGRFKRMRIQVTYHKTVDPGDVGGEMETADAPWEGAGWNYWPGEFWLAWMGRTEEEGFPFTALGGGWYHFWMEVDTQDQTGTEDFTLNPGAEVFFIAMGDAYIDQVIVDTICYEGASPPDGPGRSGGGVPNPIIIDPNVMTVYETDETRGDFDVSLRNEPPAGATITVTVDPNAEDSLNSGGPSEDIKLLGSTDPNGTITLTFTATTGGDPCDPCSWTPGNCTDWNPATRTSCWNVPQTITFKAINDAIAEPQETGDALAELQTILVSSSWPAHPTDANFVGEKGVTVTIIDNDQADILFELVGTGPIRGTPVTLLEYQDCVTLYQGICYSGWITFPQTVGVTLQVEPENDENPGSQGYVRVIVTNEGGAGNPPIMDPCLLPEHAHTPSDPNAIVFTSDGNPVPGVIGAVRKWDVPFEIVLLGNDDDELQADEAFEDGDQYYNANLVFYVDDTSDNRYAVWDEEDEEYYGIERSVDIEIEDNECGALGFLPMDISNPYYLMDEQTLGGDPNDWVDDDGNPMPDCHVDIYDVLEFVTEWLECSDPQGAGCTSYLD